jgi:CubicO group peptidase (beta-lactamase class C family)
MRTAVRAACLFGFVTGLAPPALAQPGAPAKLFAWGTATPESQGVAAARLDALRDGLLPSGTKALLVVRNDKIVYEWYAPDHNATKPHYTASLAKALVGGVALAVALSDGRIDLDDPVAKFVPRWKDDPRKAKITVRHLGSHTSGLADANEDGVPHDKLPGWKGDFWKALPVPNDPFTISRDRVPVKADPGRQFGYSNPGIAMLTYATTAALGDAPQKDVRALLKERVMRRIGAADAGWSVGYGKSYDVGGLPLVGSWGGGAYTARTAALVGRLMLRRGDWDGTRILSADAVRQTTTSAGLPGDCGMGWWTNNGGRHPKLPKDAFWGAGAGDQLLLVVPSLNLIAVRNGGAIVLPPKDKDDRKNREEGREKLFFDPLVAAVTDAKALPAAPYPPSRVITGVTWAPKEAIVSTAKDSDIWATTWADDDHLYTAYGDGTGFPPKVPEKLSLGLARIEGGPDQFTGVNVRAPTLEARGDGAKGKKASGLLMVGGVLYAWVRNAGNAQLAWSADRGRTWEWADWKFTRGFGCSTFLNFRKDYAGARDGFVYVYSHDADSAYTPADRVVLARVPKDKVRDRAAYEFFAGPGPGGAPRWSPDAAACGAAFANPGRCYRVTVSYNAGLKRYLLCQAGADAKVKAGFGIFDAPEPWGPWSTVCSSPGWDVPAGETCSLPTKWMSADGRTVHLVFSGGDSFSVRKATLAVGGAR